MADILHRIGIRATQTRVYETLTTTAGLARWWSEEVAGDAMPGGRLAFTFRNTAGMVIGRMVMQVMAAIPGQKVAWQCQEGPEDWVGTAITFDFSEQDGQVIVLFGHRGWREATEGMAHCSMKWAIFMLSLREACESGMGRPSPRDLKIDNWN